MVRPNKRLVQLRKAAHAATRARQRKRLQLSPPQSPQPESQLVLASPQPAPHPAAPPQPASQPAPPASYPTFSENNTFEAPAKPKTISQPKDGWKKAEKRLSGYSKSKHATYYQRRKVEDAIKERTELQATGGTVDRYLEAATHTSTAELSAVASSSTPFSITATSATAASSATPATPATVEDVPCASGDDTLSFIHTETAALKQWAEENKPAEQRAKRIEALLDLFEFECRNIEMYGSNHGLRIQNSRNVAVFYRRKDGWAERLRSWRKQWVESRIPPQISTSPGI